MKSIYFIVPFLGALAIAQDLVDKCQCPQVKCPGGDEVALCQCLNSRERMCQQRCPKYIPQYLPCPVKPSATPIPVPEPTPEPTPEYTPVPTPDYTPKPIPEKPCVCEQVYCLQVWPQSCYCAYSAKLACYAKCGGTLPTAPACLDTALPSLQATKPQPEPVIQALSEIAELVPEKKCVCEETYCIMSYPEGCLCQNAAKTACHKKCGGAPPELAECPPVEEPSMITTTKTPEPTSSPLPPKTHKKCGGGRANYMLCDEGEYCMNDPYTPGCGPACDGVGICVKDKMCGGFAGFECEEKGQVCHDDPRDDCDPKDGGYDCGGLCVWPHKSLNGDE